MKAPLLDTHIWVWWMLGDERLSAGEVDALDRLPPEDRPLLSEISLWEVATLVDLGRITLRESLTSWLRTAASPATVALQRLSPEIMEEMNRLPANFHRDPADRIIVATARSLARPLATRDGKITSTNLVKVWSSD